MIDARKLIKGKRLLWVRGFLFALVLLWGWFMLSTARTMEFDPADKWLWHSYFFAVFVLPWTIIPVLGMPWRRALVLASLVCMLVIISAEAFAGAQEALFRRTVAEAEMSEPIQKTIFEDRWWPCEGNFMYYKPTTKRFGGGC